MLSLLDNAAEVNAVPTKPVGSPTEIKRMTMWLEGRIERGRKEPIAEVVTLTPVLAGLLLDRNPSNRPISRTNRNEIKQDVAAGRYVFNGESVIVSENGALNDGQHRCVSVVETGVPIQTVIVFGPKEETRYTVDTGRSKSVSNFLAMKGRKYTRSLSSAVNFVLQWKQYGYIDQGADHRPSKQAILEAADALKGIDASVEATIGTMTTVGSHALMAFAHFAFCKASNRECADFFMSKLIEGDGLKKGDPILYCRNRLLQMNGTRAGTRAELAFKCWNAHRRGETIVALKLAGGKLPKLER